jgi:hypothetical protein
MSHDSCTAQRGIAVTGIMQASYLRRSRGRSSDPLEPSYACMPRRTMVSNDMSNGNDVKKNKTGLRLVFQQHTYYFHSLSRLSLSLMRHRLRPKDWPTIPPTAVPKGYAPLHVLSYHKSRQKQEQNRTQRFAANGRILDKVQKKD